MKRRDFLRAIGYGAAVSMGPSAQLVAETSHTTILYGDRTTVVAGARYLRSSNGSAGALWVPKRDLPRINQFEIKFTPQEAGKKWLDKFKKLETPYYPKLEMGRKPSSYEL